MWSDYKTPDEGGRFFVRIGAIVCVVACIMPIINTYSYLESLEHRITFIFAIVLLTLISGEFICSIFLKLKRFWVTELITFVVILILSGALICLYAYYTFTFELSERFEFLVILTIVIMLAGIIFHIVGFIRLIASTDFDKH